MLIRIPSENAEGLLERLGELKAEFRTSEYRDFDPVRFMGVFDALSLREGYSIGHDDQAAMGGWYPELKVTDERTSERIPFALRYLTGDRAPETYLQLVVLQHESQNLNEDLHEPFRAFIFSHDALRALSRKITIRGDDEHCLEDEIRRSDYARLAALDYRPTVFLEGDTPRFCCVFFDSSRGFQHLTYSVDFPEVSIFKTDLIVAYRHQPLQDMADGE